MRNRWRIGHANKLAQCDHECGIRSRSPRHAFIRPPDASPDEKTNVLNGQGFCEQLLRPEVLTRFLIFTMFAKLSSKLFRLPAAVVDEVDASETTSAGESAGPMSENSDSETPERAPAKFLDARYDVDGEDIHTLEVAQAEVLEGAAADEEREATPTLEAVPCPELARGGGESSADAAMTGRKRTAPSQMSDGQAKRRALKRYREDASGQWVKGRADDDGEWIPEPGAATFPTLESAIEHERHKTLLRRASWANLRGDRATSRRHGRP